MAKKRHKFNPDHSVSLWAMIEECMNSKGWDIDDLAVMMTWTKEEAARVEAGIRDGLDVIIEQTEDMSKELNINRLMLRLMKASQLDHRVILGHDTADSLEVALGPPAAYWIKLHQNHISWLLGNMVN